MAQQVSISVVNALFAFGQTRGFSRADLLLAGGLPPDALDSPEDRVPAETLYGVHRALELLTRDEAWGLAVFHSVSLGSYGIAEYIFRSQDTLVESFRALVRYFSLISEVSRLSLEQTPGGTRLEAQLGDPRAMQGSLPRTLNQNLMSSALITARQITGKRIVPARITFPFSAPADVRPYLDCFGIEPNFGEGSAASMLFDDASMATPVLDADPALRRILEEYADLLIQRRSGAPEDLTDQVRRTILQQLQSGNASVQAVAGRLSTSTRSLQRHLAERGHSFKSLLDEVRFDFARHCLEESRFSVDEISLLLGYSDNSAFVKAFKRWGNTTPGEYRQRHRAQH